MALKKFDRSRQNIELLNPIDRIPKDHVCFIVKEIVESIDFSEINEKYVHTPGEPAYDREQLAMLVLMGALDGKFSGRKIAEMARINLVYIYLSGNATPDQRTINRFKKENKELMRKAFVRTREIGRELGIVTLKNLAIDGTTVKANASKKSRYDKIDLLIAKELVEKGIIVDEEEDRLYGEETGDTLTKEDLNQVKKEIKKQLQMEENKKKKKRKKNDKNYKKNRKDESNEGDVDGIGVKNKVLHIVKQGSKDKKGTLKKINKSLDEADKKNLDRISFTDPNAHWRPNKQHYYELVHNFQIIGDTDSRFIIENRVVDAVTDMNQLIPLMDNLQIEIGDFDENTLLNADNGYFNGDNLKYIDQQGFVGLIPNKTQASKAKGKEIPRFHKHNFTYNHLNDTYKCPNDKILNHKSTSNEGVKLYYCDDCHSCFNKDDCCKSNIRVISAYKNEQYMQEMKIKFEDEDNKMKYNQRAIVEGNFGHIFSNLGFLGFKTRGTENVQVEADILSFANNTKRIHTEKRKIKEKIKKQTQRTHKITFFSVYPIKFT